MFRKTLSFGGLLLLTGAVVLVTPGSGQAQHGGGGHGGGGHGGGGHGGGFHAGGGHAGGFHAGGGHAGGFHAGGMHGGGFNHGGFNHSGFNHGGFDHGFHHGDFDHGFHHDGFRGSGGWWYPGYYGSYGASPSYYGSYPYSGYSGYYPDTSSSDWSSPGYDSGYYGSYGDVTSSDARAHVTVSVPADAEIWAQGSKMTLTGSVREFQSPPLTPGKRYTYEIRARWSENGHEVAQTQQVPVAAGAHVSVRFPVQPAKARTAPSD